MIEKPVLKAGKRVDKMRTPKEIRESVLEQLRTLKELA